MATRFAKTSAEHIYCLDSSNWIPIMGGRDVEELWGIGKRTAARLAAHGLRTVTDLAWPIVPIWLPGSGQLSVLGCG
jgi:DNA polymerase IV